MLMVVDTSLLPLRAASTKNLKKQCLFYPKFGSGVCNFLGFKTIRPQSVEIIDTNPLKMN